MAAGEGAGGSDPAARPPTPPWSASTLDPTPSPYNGASTERVAVVSAAGGTTAYVTRDVYPLRSQFPSWRRAR